MTFPNKTTIIFKLFSEVNQVTLRSETLSAPWGLYHICNTILDPCR